MNTFQNTTFSSPQKLRQACSFGKLMPERSVGIANYRYSFQGQDVNNYSHIYYYTVNNVK